MSVPPLVLASSVLALAGCLFPMSHGDIQAANAQHVHRMCTDRNYAYETGYNHGLKRGHLDTSWVERSCAPERRASIRGGYHDGYNIGIANAPIVVRGSTRVITSSPSSPSCMFSSDCDDGQSCRSGVCMGNGWTGDACWFSSDCLSDSCDARVCR